MSASIIDPAPDQPTDLGAAIRQFIAAESAALSHQGAERHAVVADALFDFLESVDVTPRLGAEVARHLENERGRLGAGAFLPTLGLVSLVRMLPEFLEAPWLPPVGAQRRSHRAVIQRLLVFLRRRGLTDSAVLRDDYSRARKALSNAHSRDYGWTTSDEPAMEELIPVTVELRSIVLDPLLKEIELGSRTSLTDAIDARLDPHRRYEEGPCSAYGSDVPDW